jgi:hypothetical protein
MKHVNTEGPLVSSPAAQMMYSFAQVIAIELHFKIRCYGHICIECIATCIECIAMGTRVLNALPRAHILNALPRAHVYQMRCYWHTCIECMFLTNMFHCSVCELSVPSFLVHLAICDHAAWSKIRILKLVGVPPPLFFSDWKNKQVLDMVGQHAWNWFMGDGSLFHPPHPLLEPA